MADDLRPAERRRQRAAAGVGLGSLAQSWLGDFDVALPAVGLVGTWVCYGLAMVLLTAGVQKIPPSLYDAARVDGAGIVREFFAVTLPALRGEIAVALTLTTIYALRNFDLVYITTKGGPGDATSVPGVPGLRPRVPERPGRLGGCDRDLPRRPSSSGSRSRSTTRRSEAAVTSRRD